MTARTPWFHPYPRTNIFTPSPSTARRERILLADDQEGLRGILGHLLEAEGYVVFHATDGEEAVRMARQERPDLILMDLVMPRQSGVTALQELRGDPSTAEIPVLAVTATLASGAKQDLVQEGFVGLLAKPFTFKQLLAEIRRALPQTPRGGEGGGSRRGGG